MSGRAREPWLIGVRARLVAPSIYQIRITGYGPALVGDYRSLRSGTGGGTGLEAHHIVGVEHLKMVRTRFDQLSAPSVAITAGMHRALISPRIGAEQRYLGGRPRGGRLEADVGEICDLYRDVYTFHTPFQELFVIARNVLRSSVDGDPAAVGGADHAP